MNTDYQSLIKGIFMCGEQAVTTAVSKENAQLVVDLRAEAEESAGGDDVNWVRVPLVNGEPNQSELLWKAIQHVTGAYEEGNRVVLH